MMAKQQQAYSSYSWTWQVLGILVGIAACVSIVKNVGSIELAGFPTKVLAQYLWVRETLFDPVVWGLRHLGFPPIPWWAKDAIMAYGLIAAAFWRASKIIQPSTENISAGSLRFTLAREMRLFWPYAVFTLLLEWRTAARYRARAEDLLNRGSDPAYEQRYSARADRELARILTDVKVLALQIVLVIVGTVAFFVWNYLEGTYGRS